MVNNTYKRWIEYTNTDKQYFLYLSYKQFFAKRIKNRVTKKWHSRYCKERSKRYKQLAKVDNRYKIYFGKTVYTYYNHDNDIFGFTINPKQDRLHTYPYNDPHIANLSCEGYKQVLGGIFQFGWDEEKKVCDALELTDSKKRTWLCEMAKEKWATTWPSFISTAKWQ